MIPRIISTMSPSHLMANSCQISRHFASFSERMENKQMEKQREEFVKEMKFMANKPEYTLIDFRQRINDGISKSKKGTSFILSLSINAVLR